MSDVESKIKELIEIYRAKSRNVAAYLVVEDLESLLKLEQEKSCKSDLKAERESKQ